MNQIDNYLVCLEEGKIWDKTKEYAKKAGSFVKKHKGKILAGAAIGAAAYGGHKVLKKTPEERASINKKKEAKSASDKKIKNATIAKLQAKQDKSNDTKGKLAAAAYAGAKTTEIVTRPVRWAASKVGGAVKDGATYVAKSAKNKMVQSVSDTYNKMKYRKNLRKSPKQQGVIGAAIQGFRGK